MDTTDLPKILCVDDEKNILSSLRREMRKKYNITTALSASEAISILNEDSSFDVIVSDFRMPGMDGAEFLKIAKNIAPNSTRILLTGQASPEGMQSVVNDSKVYKILFKPCSTEDLLAAVYEGVKQHRDKRTSTDQLDELLKSIVP